MFDNYFFLKRIVKELNQDLKQFKFFKSISQSKNELVTGFFLNDQEKFLIFTFQKLPPLIYLKDDFQFAKKNYAEFFELLSEKILIEVTIDNFERNIRFNFENLSLVFLFRGHHSNVVLLNKHSQLILDSFKKSDEVSNKNFNELFPISQIDISYFTEEEKFNSLFEEGNAQNKRYLKIIGKFLVDELEFRKNQTGKSYFQTFNEILNEIEKSPLLVYNDWTSSFFNSSQKTNHS